MSRIAARELVLHFTFESEYTGNSGEEIMERSLNEERFATLKEEYALYEKLPAEAQDEYVKRATTGIISHMNELDGYIEKYAKGWNVGRISRISKAILRLSMYEILYMDIPVGASVNEALELAKKYDGEETVGFINGILSTFSKNEIIK